MSFRKVGHKARNGRKGKPAPHKPHRTGYKPESRQRPAIVSAKLRRQRQLEREADLELQHYGFRA